MMDFEFISVPMDHITALGQGARTTSQGLENPVSAMLAGWLWAWPPLASLLLLTSPAAELCM